MNQKVIHTKLLILRISIYPWEDPTVFIKFSGLHSHNFSLQHSPQNLFDILAELFDLTTSAFRGINSVESKSEPGQSISELKGNFNCISISYFEDFAQKRFVVQRKLLCIIDKLHFPILVLSWTLFTRNSEASWDKILQGFLNLSLFSYFSRHSYFYLLGFIFWSFCRYLLDLLLLFFDNLLHENVLFFPFFFLQDWINHEKSWLWLLVVHNLKIL